MFGRKAGGFTLTELMIVAALVGLIFMLVPPLIRQFHNLFQLTAGSIAMERDLRNSMDVLSKQLRFARSQTVALSTPIGEPVYSRCDFTTSTGQAVRVVQRQGELIIAFNGVERTLCKNVVRVFFLYPDYSDKNTIKLGLMLSKNISADKPPLTRHREATITLSAI